MNFLFLRQSIKWATEFNPNRMDAYSSTERVQQHKQAIFRTDHIITNQEQLAKYNQRLDLIYLATLCRLQTVQYTPTELSKIQVDEQYAKIAQQLIEKLDEFEKVFQAALNTKIKNMIYNCTHNQPLHRNSFLYRQNIHDSLKPLKQLQSDYDIRTFFTSVADLRSVAEIHDDLKELQTLSGYNAQWSLSEIPRIKSKLES